MTTGGYDKSIMCELKQLEAKALQLLSRLGEVERELRRRRPRPNLTGRISELTAAHEAFRQQALRYVAVSADIPAVNGEAKLVARLRSLSERIQKKWEAILALSAASPELLQDRLANGSGNGVGKKKESKKDKKKQRR